MKLLRTKARWNTDATQRQIDLGLDPNKESYEYRDVLVNCDQIAYIENYEGLCCVSYSGIIGDEIITCVPFKDGFVFGHIMD